MSFQSGDIIKEYLDRYSFVLATYNKIVLKTEFFLISGKQYFLKEDHYFVDDLSSKTPITTIGHGEMLFYYMLEQARLKPKSNHDENNPDLEFILNGKKRYVEIKSTIKEKENDYKTIIGSVQSYKAYEALCELRGSKNRSISIKQTEKIISIMPEQKRKDFCEKYKDIIDVEHFNDSHKIATFLFKNLFNLLFDKKPGRNEYILYFREFKKWFQLIQIPNDISMISESFIYTTSPILDGMNLKLNFKKFLENPLFNIIKE